MRRALPLPILALLLLPGEAIAQPSVELRLLDQTGFATPKRAFRLSAEAYNATSQAFGDLTMTLWVYNPVRSRSEVEASLEAEPPLAPILVEPYPLEGELDPGERLPLSIDRRLPELVNGGNALYPVKLLLDSAGVEVAALRTFLVFVTERPLVPLSVSLTFLLDERVALRPSGIFGDDRLERALGEGGHLEALVGALERQPMQATVVVSPILLDQLDRMSRGYRIADGEEVRSAPAGSPEAERARVMLERIRALARNPVFELVSLPLASPAVPSLVAAGLHRDLESHIVRGRDLTSALLGVEPIAGYFRPPGSILDAPSVRALADLGIQALILDAGALQPIQGLTLSPPGQAHVGAGNGRTIPAVAPDAGITGLLGREGAEPRLLAQRLLAILSIVYLEQPSVDRGVAIVLDARRMREEPFLTSLLGQLARASRDLSPKAGWLQPVTVSRLLSAPAGAAAPRSELVPVRPRRLTPRYLAGLRRARGAIEQLESLTDQAPELVQRLKVLLLLSQSSEFLRDEAAAISFLRAIERRVEVEFAKVHPPDGTAITLTSRRGIIPVTIGNSAGYPLRVEVTLVSPRLDFVEGESRTVTLDRPQQALTFPVLAQTTGRFPVRILVRTPGGSPIAESRIVVRSTALNARALLIVAAAVGFLLFLWGRRRLLSRGPR